MSPAHRDRNPAELTDGFWNLVTYLAVAGLLGDVPAALFALVFYSWRLRGR